MKIVIDQHERSHHGQAAKALNRSGASVVSLQHEFGIFGGPSGGWLLDLLGRLRLPVVTTCHTVLRDPSREQHQIMCAIAGHSTRLVVMAEKGREFLRGVYSDREGLRTLAAELGVAQNLRSIDRFVSRDELVNLIAAADLYITPHVNEAQITSGTLAYAFGMGKPVISTPYWQAAELLAEDQGVLVPFRDSSALAKATLTLLEDSSPTQAMSQRAYQMGRAMTWETVGRTYAAIFESACTSEFDPPAMR